MIHILTCEHLGCNVLVRIPEHKAYSNPLLEGRKNTYELTQYVFKQGNLSFDLFNADDHS